MLADTDDRHTRSLVYPGMRHPEGSWFCLTCPAYGLELQDPLTPALEHRDSFTPTHPIVATPYKTCECEHVDIGIGYQRVTNEPDCPRHGQE